MIQAPQPVGGAPPVYSACCVCAGLLAVEKPAGYPTPLGPVVKELIQRRLTKRYRPATLSPRYSCSSNFTRVNFFFSHV